LKLSSRVSLVCVTFLIRYKELISYIPSVGILVVLMLYVTAANLYPGGSEKFPDKAGFDWVHNYWCDLLPSLAINGDANPAEIFGISAMILLCGVVAVFFFLFADAYPFSKTWRLIIKVCGVASMFCGALIFTSLHNTMIGVASLLAIPPIIGVFKGLIKERSTLHLSMGILVFVLLAMCNITYYLGVLEGSLPLIQKVAMAVTLLWIVVISESIRRRHLSELKN